VSDEGATTGSLILAPPGEGEVVLFTLSPDRTSAVGRTEQCDIRLHDAHISKRHALIHCEDGDWFVTDLDSHNGTFINNDRVIADKPVRLGHGTLLSFGPVVFRVGLPEHSTSHLSSRAEGGTYATHASMFQRLRDESPGIRELEWEEFRGRYGPVIRGFSRKFGPRAEDAEDVLQEVMLGFFRVAPQFEYDPRKGRFRGYLKRATANVIRKRARRPGAAEIVSEQVVEQQMATAESSFDEHWEEQLFDRALEAARDRFDAVTFEAFELYGRHGVPAREVAERLEINVNSVHQAKSRVLKTVSEIVERLKAEEG
jgi:RNA polymerase sigma factor (sigma-70 family)